jgi:nucleotide-binding universal stress UspA family protein
LARDLGRVAAVHARYADVAVMTRPADGAGIEMREEIVEGVLFYSGRPALIAPPGWKGDYIAKRAVVAWDASREATRALSEADDILEFSEKVTVLTVDAKPKAFGHGDQPGANIAGHLQRRGLNADVHNVESKGRAPAEAILEEADRLGADLLVMGGYAHSRLRELVFGGATRDLLRVAHIPVLMAH